MFSMQVRGQSVENLKVHDPANCSYRPREWGKIKECPLPVFEGTNPVVRIYSKSVFFVYSE